jgi:hypothetical protein
MPTKKGVKGRRVAVSWGSVTRTIKGKKTKVPALSLVKESVIALTGLKPFKQTAALKLTKDKKGRTRIAAPGLTRSATRHVLVWTGEYGKGKSKQKVWHRVPLPTGISLAVASKQLQGGKKVVEVRTPSTLPGRSAILKAAPAAKK